MNETKKKAQQTIAEERKTKIREHGNLKRYLSQIRKTAKTLKETLEQTQKVLDTVGLGSASNAIITSPNAFFVKHFEDKIRNHDLMVKIHGENTDGSVKSYFGLKAPGAEDKWRMKTPFGTSDGSFRIFWDLVKQGKLDWDEDTDKIFDDTSLKLLAENCGWATLRLEDCPKVSCFHLGFHYAHGGLQKRKSIKKTKAGEHSVDSTFQVTGRLIGVGNKCCAVLHDCPTSQTNPTKSFVNAYGKGRGIIKKWVYSESVLRLEVIQREDFIAAYKTTETRTDSGVEEVLGGLDSIMATKVSEKLGEREAEEKQKKIHEASKLTEKDLVFFPEDHQYHESRVINLKTYEVYNMDDEGEIDTEKPIEGVTISNMTINRYIKQGLRADIFLTDYD